MRRDELRAIQRKPELSQHFLRDGAARALVRRAALPARALVVEAGAGDGALTAALAEAGHRVIAIERDRRLAGRLARRFAASADVTPGCADFLAFVLPREPYHAVANVPYGITAAIVRKLLHAANPPNTATLIVQREAACKFAGDPRETLFSLLHKPRFAIDIACGVSRHDFVPPPRVQSTVLRIVRRDVAMLDRREMRRYRAFIETAFAHGSPELAPALRRYLTSPQVKRLFRAIGVDRSARTSHVTFEQWLTIFRVVEHECLGHDPTSRAAAA